GRGDRVPDLVRNGRRQLAQARLLLGLHDDLLALQLALDRGIEVARLERARSEDAHPVREQPEAPPERRPQEPGIPGGHDVDQREQRDDGEVADEVHVEAGLGRRPAAGADQRVVLSRWLLGRRPALPARGAALLSPAIPLVVALHLGGPFPVPVGVPVPVALGLLGPVTVPLRPLLPPVAAPVRPVLVAVAVARPPVEVPTFPGPDQPLQTEPLLEMQAEHQRDDESDGGHSPVLVTSNPRAARLGAGPPASAVARRSIRTAPAGAGATRRLHRRGRFQLPGGSRRTRWAMMLRCTSEVPAAIVRPRE